MSTSGRWIGTKFVVKDPEKTAKNFRCKVNAAKLREKKIKQHGFDGLQAHNDAKRASVQEKRDKEVDALRAATLTGKHSAHTRISALEDEVTALKKTVEELELKNTTEVKMRKEYEKRLRNFDVAFEKKVQEREALWSMIRKLKQENQTLKDAQTRVTHNEPI